MIDGPVTWKERVVFAILVSIGFSWIYRAFSGGISQFSTVLGGLLIIFLAWSVFELSKLVRWKTDLVEKWKSLFFELKEFHKEKDQRRCRGECK